MKSLVLLVLCVFCHSASPQKGPRNRTPAASSQSWKAEPTAFWNITFGQPLKSSLQECPKHVDQYGSDYLYPKTGERCFQDRGLPFVQVVGLDGFYNVFVQAPNDRVALITAQFGVRDSESTAAALLAKFGPPTTRGSAAVLPSGAPSGLKMIWVGQDLRLSYSSVSGRAGFGELAVTSRAWRDYEAHKKSEDAGKLASCF